ncbi:MAG TPA: hypothetical protein VJU17_01895, partial [Gemmatimonadales bacterium]|nr:hypothetical protein [Gemmatimonadales bacterium]
HQGIGTDRFVVAWEVGGAAGQMSSGVASGDRRGDRSGTEVVVEIPHDIQELIVADPAAARKWRESTRPAFLRLLADGYRVAGFERSPAGGFYRLTRDSD